MMVPDERREGAAPPRGHSRLLRGVQSFLVSPELAIALLVAILASCVAGVTVVRGARAGQLIFGALWFNGLLVLLAFSSFAAFFSRTWKRRLTLVQVGMILFHLSFAALLGAIAWNRLCRFDGTLRLTEGETLPLGRFESYDRVDAGRFFDPSTLRGEVTLLRMHVNYAVDGENKQAAYDLAIGDGETAVRRVIYVANHTEYQGLRFFCEKEGYSLLVVMHDSSGREVSGAHIPLQSFKLAEGGYLYASGTSAGEAAIPFPTPPERPLVELSLRYRPNTVEERKGDVTLRVRRLVADGSPGPEAVGTVAVGERFAVAGGSFSPLQVRYWVGINVRHDPGLMAVFASLCFGTLGMVLTFVGRVRRGAARARPA